MSKTPPGTICCGPLIDAKCLFKPLPGETILPPNIADGIQSLVAAEGKYTFNISVVDAGSIAQLFASQWSHSNAPVDFAAITRSIARGK